MNTKTLLAALIGGVFYFFLGWLVFGYLMADYSMANTTQYAGLMKNPPNLVTLFISNFLWALLIAIIYSKWANISTFGAGLSAGFWIAAPMMAAYNLDYHSFFNLYTSTYLAVNFLVGTFFVAVGGGVIGCALGLGKKAPSA